VFFDASLSLKHSFLVLGQLSLPPPSSKFFALASLSLNPELSLTRVGP